MGKNDKPFSFLDKYFDTKPDLHDFFVDKTQFSKSLLMSNFLLSLLEFSNFIKKTENRENLSGNNSSISIHPDIFPVWGTMDSPDFIDQTERLFINLDDILKFCDLITDNISAYREQFWDLWKSWKRICLNEFGDYGRLVRKENHLTLPGEPISW